MQSVPSRRKRFPEAFQFSKFALILPVLLAVDRTTHAAMLTHIEAVSPRVGQRGTTVEVLIQGSCLKNPREVIFYRPGIKAIEITPLPKLQSPIGTAHGGRIEEQVRCKFAIAPDCLPGEYPFRLRTATEITSLGTFHVTPFRVIDENEQGYNSNDSLATALAVKPDVTIRGRIGPSARGDVDLFRVPVFANQRLAVEIDSARIGDIHYGGSEFDLAVRILDEQGRELASNDDNPVHLQDPLIAVKTPRTGFAFVEVRRSVFVPEDRVYSLHIGSYRRPLAAFPPGGQSGTTCSIRFIGDPLGDYQESVVIPGLNGTFDYFGDAPSPLHLRSRPYPNVIEETSAMISRVDKLPAALNGLIETRDDIDAYRVTVKKGERLRVRVYAAALGSPIDARLAIRAVDAAGRPGPIEIESDDSLLSDRDVFGTSFRSGGGLKDTLDPSIIWEPRTNGNYLIELSDTSGSGGPTAIYRIEIEPAADRIDTMLTSTAFDWMECMRTSGLAVPQGNRWTVNLSLPRIQGTTYRGELDLVAHGLPAGVQFVTSRVPREQTLWPVQFVADAHATPGASLITIEARPTDSSHPLESHSQQNIPFINHPGGDAWRAVQLDRYVLAVTDPAPFSIEIKSPTVSLVRGGELAIPIKVNRQKNFKEAVEFQCDWVPAGVAVQPTTIIPFGQNESLLRINAENRAPLGDCPIVVTASTTRDDIDAYLGTGRIRVSSEIVRLTIAEPFVELASQPQSVRRGERKKYVWTVTPKSLFEGNATITLLGLPKGVTLGQPRPTLTKNSSSIEFQLEASDEALLGSVNGITCEVIVRVGGQEIRQRTGNGTLRIDPRL